MIISELQKSRIENYAKALAAENELQNLISTKSHREIPDKHIADVLIPFCLEKHTLHGSIADMGSGGGIPGIVLAILFPESDFTLVETEGRKADFLLRTVRELEIRNVTVYKGRLEALGAEKRGYFDFITSRALAHIGICCEYAAPLLKTGGILYLLKGPNYGREIEESSNAFEQLNMKLENTYEYEIDFGGETFLRYLISIEKHGKTPGKYPRKPGMAKKRPL